MEQIFEFHLRFQENAVFTLFGGTFLVQWGSPQEVHSINVRYGEFEPVLGRFNLSIFNCGCMIEFLGQQFRLVCN